MQTSKVHHRYGRAVLLGWLVFMICAARDGSALPSPPAATISGVSAGGTILGFGGSATYTGQLGPVSAARLICICASRNPNLGTFLGCIDIATNGATYFAPTFNTTTYFVVAFLDLSANIALDPGEPYQIYNGRNAPPGDPVVAGPAQTDINFSFGDENLWPPAALTPTSTASATPSPSPTPSVTSSPTHEPSATATPSPASTPAGHCTGDCDGGGDVAIDELVMLVNMALGNAPIESCVAGDADGSGAITVNEIVAAVNAALGGCSTGSASSVVY